ncbi:MAG: pyridoxal-phosphate dependent enzyme [Thermoleophilia bacterium]|nr:pyridoxal-phosphate dependent enzyme [Thermoleophilia bacterium]MDH4340083.1 pyridoxal-phosphate dependent enzyme [Thermoleophilia bacterium]
MAPTIADIRAARRRLSGVARETPLYPTETFSRLSGRSVFLKAENLQRTGSFKIRGAYNTIATLGEAERQAGVVAASAGNHGQAVAWAAREAGIPATIFMPQDAPMAKVEATRSYGGATELMGEGFEDAVAAAHAHVERTGATLVHAFEDERVIAGQGTIGLELAEQAPDAETVLVPIGGGGLAAGIALALKELRPDVRVVGIICQPGYTIADGIAVKHRGELASLILDRFLDETVSVSDDEISEALVLCVERTKFLVEGAGAVGLAALLAGRVPGSGSVAVVLSGGNIDATTLISVLRHGLTQSGRFLALRLLIPDRPGELRKILDLIARGRGNVVSVDHHREGRTTSALQTEIELVISTRDEAHCQELLELIRSAGHTVERVGPPS